MFLYHKGNEQTFDGISRQDLSQLIILIELGMSSKLSYKVSFTYVKTNPHVSQGSNGKQPLLCPLLHKNTYTTVYFP